VGKPVRKQVRFRPLRHPAGAARFTAFSRQHARRGTKPGEGAEGEKSGWAEAPGFRKVGGEKSRFGFGSRKRKAGKKEKKTGKGGENGSNRRPTGRAVAGESSARWPFWPGLGKQKLVIGMAEKGGPEARGLFGSEIFPGRWATMVAPTADAKNETAPSASLLEQKFPSPRGRGVSRDLGSCQDQRDRHPEIGGYATPPPCIKPLQKRSRRAGIVRHRSARDSASCAKNQRKRPSSLRAGKLSVAQAKGEGPANGAHFPALRFA